MRGKRARILLCALFSLALAVGLAPMFASAAPNAAEGSTNLVGGELLTASGDEDPITAISYEQAAPIELVEECNGEWVPSSYEDGPEGGEDWFHYNYSFPNLGDKLIITRESGSTEYEFKEIVGEEYEWGYSSYNAFVSEDGDEFYNYSWWHTQSYSNQWKAGNTYELTVFSWENEEITAPAYVSIVANPVKSIAYTYTGKSQLVEGVDGHETYDEIYDENDEPTRIDWFRYDVYACPGDVLTVITDEGTKDYEYTDLGWDENNCWLGTAYVNVDDPEDQILDDVVSIRDNQSYDAQWAAGNTYQVEVAYMGRKTTFDVEVVENPVESIDYTYAGKSQFMESADGYDTTTSIYDDETGEETIIHWCRYGIYSGEGDVLAVTTDEGTKDYEYMDLGCDEDGYWLGAVYVNADDPEDQIPAYMVSIYDNQSYDAQWAAGNTYQVEVAYMGRKTTFDIEVTENPVESISFNPADHYELVENSDGCLENEGEDDEYYRYNLPGFYEGDTLAIVGKDGSATDYVYGYDYDYDEWVFVSADGDAIYLNDIEINSDQEDNHWTLGSENYFTIKYMGKTCQVPVTIVENPVASITFKSATIPELIENDQGEWDFDVEGQRYFRYYLPSFSEGDTLTVVGKDGSETVYVCGYDYDCDEWTFVSADGDAIYQDDIEINSDQEDNHWTLGEENYYSIEYKGQRFQVPVTIVENPLDSIVFAPAEPYEFAENSGGHLENEGEDDEYYRYYLTGFYEGDTLTLTGKDGSEVAYVYSEDEGLFASADGASIYEDDIDMYSDQEYSHWTLGGDNYFTVEYMGKTCQVPVAIVENPVDSIAFEPANPYKYVENTNGDWDEDGEGEGYFVYWTPWFNDGDMLTVTGKDGSVTTYIYDEYHALFVSDDGKIIDGGVSVLDDQRNNHWLPGSDNYFTVEYMGQPCQVPVTIVENTVAAIAFDPAKPYELTENTGGGWREDGYYDEDDNWIESGEFYRYTLPDFENGDKLTVTDKYDSELVYTFKSDEQMFVSTEGDVIDPDDIDRYSEQYDTHWTVGEENYFTLEYMGQTCQVAVTIVEMDPQNIGKYPPRYNYCVAYDRQPMTVEKLGLELYTRDGDGDEVPLEYGTHYQIVKWEQRIYEYDEDDNWIEDEGLGGTDLSEIVDMGYYVLTLEGISPHIGTITIDFEIVDSNDLSYAVIEGVQDKYYLGDDLDINPVVSTAGGLELSEGDDYTIYIQRSDGENGWETVDAITAAGKYRILVEASDSWFCDYIGSTTYEFEVMENDTRIELDDTFTISGVSESYEYVYEPIEPKPEVKDADGNALEAGVDYNVSYEDNENVGAATMTIEAAGNYKGKLYASFTIVPAPIEKATASAIPAQTYTGQNIEPAINLSFLGKPLVENRDYTVAYENNKDEGTANAVITGKGNFHSAMTLTFTIVKDEPDGIEQAQEQAASDRRAAEIAQSEADQAKAEAEAAQSAAEASLRAAEAAQASGAANAVELAQKAATDSAIAQQKAQTYQAKAMNAQTLSAKAASSAQRLWTIVHESPDATEEQIAGADQALATAEAQEDVANTAVENASTAINKANKTATAASTTVKEASKPISISSGTVAALSTKTYTGQAITQSPTLTVGGKKLTLNTDYTVSYKNNVNAGTATVTFTGKGRYTGAKTATFTISKAKGTFKVKAKKKVFTVKAGKSLKAKNVFKVTKNKPKGKVTYALASAPKAAKKYIKVAKNGKITVKKGIKKGKTYKIKVKATATSANYEASKVVTLKIKVQK